MKKLFVLFAALLMVSMTGLAFADKVVDPSAGPEQWTTAVYNNSGGTLDVGDIVVWDIDSSTGDNDNYVTTTTTACTHLVAGVVWPSDIAAGARGSIVRGGVVDVDAVSGLITTDTAIGTSTTAGSAGFCNTTAAGIAGHALAQEASNTVKVYLQLR